MLLRAATETMPVVLLPLGLVFHEPGTFRTGWALVLVGPPVRADDCVALYRRDPERAVRELTDRLREALGRQIIEADDRQTLRLLGVVETLWRGQAPASTGEETARVAAIQQVARARHELQERVPERLAALRQRVEIYSKDLERFGGSNAEIRASYRPGLVLRWTVREALPLLLGFPLALVGMLLHAIPYWLTAAVVRALGRTDEEEATDKILAGTVFYPLCWGVEGWVAWRIGGGWALGALLLALLPTGFFALGWQERGRRVARETRAFLRFLADRDLRRHLLARRRELVDEIAALAQLVESGRGSTDATRG